MNTISLQTIGQETYHDIALEMVAEGHAQPTARRHAAVCTTRTLVLNGMDTPAAVAMTKQIAANDTTDYDAELDDPDATDPDTSASRAEDAADGWADYWHDREH